MLRKVGYLFLESGMSLDHYLGKPAIRS
jgi:hypothetical protein